MDFELLHRQEPRRGPLPQLCQRRPRGREEGGRVGLRAAGPARRALPPRPVGRRGAADRPGRRSGGGDAEGQFRPLIRAEESKFITVVQYLG